MPKPQITTEAVQELFAKGAREIVIRVSSWDHDLETPASYQVLVRHRIRDTVWGVGVMAGVRLAFTRAYDAFMKHHAERIDAPAKPVRETVDNSDLLG